MKGKPTKACNQDDATGLIIKEIFNIYFEVKTAKHAKYAKVPKLCEREPFTR